jgi:hypothetical protein
MDSPRLVMLTMAMTMALAVSGGAQSPPLKTVMQEKAQNAQGLLKPLVLGDFTGIERYATRLGHLTFTEVASWQADPNPEYVVQARAFLQAIEDIGQAADARNLTRATSAYADLVSSCVNCHKLVRGRQPVLLTPPAPLLDPPRGGDTRK